MGTYLQILNKARNKDGNASLSETQILSGNAEALKGYRAVANAVEELLSDALDLDTERKIATVSTVSGIGKITSPTASSWDSNVIKQVKYYNGTQLLKLIPVTPYEAEDMKLMNFTEAFPQYWYIYNQELYVLPIPAAIYELRVFYNRLMPNLELEDMTSELVIDSFGEAALEAYTYAYLREASKDPLLPTFMQRAEIKKRKYYERNRNSEKRNGLNNTIRKITSVRDRGL